MLRIILSNKASQLIGLIGMIIAALTLIAQIAPDEVRTLVGLDKDQVERTPVTKPSPPTGYPNAFHSSSNYTVGEHQTQYIKDAQANLSVVFQNIDGGNFVSLTISTIGKESSVHAILNGYTEEFQSSTGVFYVQVLNIDYAGKKVVVRVDRKL